MNQSVVAFSRRFAMHSADKFCRNLATSLFAVPTPSVLHITDDYVDHLVSGSEYIHYFSESHHATTYEYTGDTQCLFDRLASNCRYLSTLPKSVSRPLLFKTYNKLIAYLARESPLAVFGYPPDIYTLFLLEHASRTLSIPYISSLPHRFSKDYSVVYVNEDFLASSPLNGRVANSPIELASCIKQLRSSGFDPWEEKVRPHMLQIFVCQLKRALKGEISIAISFIVSRMLSWNRLPSDTYPYRKSLSFTCHPSIPRSLSYLKQNTCSIDAVFVNPRYIESRKKGKVVYVPLQFMPESTNEYYIDNGYCNLRFQLFDIHRLLIRNDYFIVYKEHPFCDGLRDPNIYRRLSSPQSVLIKTSTPKASIFSSVSFSLLSGTLSVEALSESQVFISLGQSRYLPAYVYNSVSVSDLESMLIAVSGLLMDPEKFEQYQTHCKDVLASHLTLYLNSTFTMPDSVPAPAIKSIYPMLKRLALNLR